MFTTGPKSVFARVSSIGRSRSRQSKRYRPGLSLLEDRTLLAVTFTAEGVSTNTGNVVSAAAIFDKPSDDILQIVLINTSPNPQSIRRGDTLTGVVWDINGAKPTLLSPSITVTPGSNVYTDANHTGSPSIPPTSWDFKGAPGGPYTYSNGVATFQYGFSTIGGGVFNGKTVDGDDYGLIADAQSLSNPSFSNSAFPLIVNSLTFQLTGFTADLSQIGSVKFTYGSEPNYVLPAPGIDLGLTKTVSNLKPNVGDTVNFTVSLTNPGPGNALGVVVTDALPTGLDYVSSVATAGSYNPNTGNWVVGSVAAGKTETLTLSAVVTGCGTFMNTAQITATGQPDPNPANDSATATVIPLNADLTVTKTVSTTTPSVNQPFTYTVNLTNSGPDPAREVVVTDKLPAGLTLLSSTPTVGTYDPNSGVWSVGGLQNNTSATLTLQVSADTAGTFTNIAFVSNTATADCNPGNESAQQTITVGTPPIPPPEVDLSIRKTVSNARPNAGDSVTFALTVSNPSDNAVDRVVVQDLIPPNLIVESVSFTQGSVNAQNSTWSVGTVAPGGSATLTLVGRVAGCDPFNNTARIIAAGLPDPDPSNNTSTVTVTPLKADLEVTKTASNAIPILGRLFSFPILGRPFSFTVTLTNKGPDPAEGVALTDQLPAGLTLLSSSTSRGTYDAATGIWTVGTLAPDDPVTLNLTVQATASGLTTNLAAITGTNTCDPTSINDASKVGVFAIDPAVLAPGVINLERFGFHHQPTALVLTFNRPLDPARVANVANYHLVALFQGGRLRVKVPIAKAVYDPTQDTVTLTPKYHGRPFLPLHRSYELTVVGTSGSGITSAIGIPLDGRGNRSPGTDYVRRFGFEILAGTNRPGAPLKPFDRLRSGAASRRAALPARTGLAVAHHRSPGIG